MSKEITVSVTFKMDERTARLFMQSSIERVINTSMRCVEKPDLEVIDINLEDWQEWKPVVCSMWNALHDAIYRSKAGMAANEEAYRLTKGEIE